MERRYRLSIFTFTKPSTYKAGPVDVGWSRWGSDTRHDTSWAAKTPNLEEVARASAMGRMIPVAPGTVTWPKARCHRGGRPKITSSP